MYCASCPYRHGSKPLKRILAAPCFQDRRGDFTLGVHGFSRGPTAKAVDSEGKELGFQPSDLQY